MRAHVQIVGAVFFLLMLFLLAGVVCLEVGVGELPDAAARGRKIFSRVLGQGVVVRLPKEPAPRLSCGDCRLEKMRLGHLSLGGVNVLVLEDLVINLPREAGATAPPESGAAANGRSAGRSSSGDWRTLVSSLPALSGGRKKMFSAVRVSRLSVNRMLESGLEPVFQADSAQNEGSGLGLKNCSVVVDGVTNRLKSAKLICSGRLVLKWGGRELDVQKGSLENGKD